MVDTQNTEQQTISEKIIIPEKFKDTKTGEIKVDELLKSYLALEKKLSSRKNPLPPLTQGTLPASYKDYSLVMKNPKLVPDEAINQRLFNLGFTNEQVQAVYDLAADTVIPLLEELSADYRADKEMAELEREFGGADAFNTIARQISAWGEKNLKPDIFNALSSSKDGVMAIYKMMAEGSEPQIETPKTPVQDPISEEALRALMRNPKYWKGQDMALMKRVEEGFKRLYK